MKILVGLLSLLAILLVALPGPLYKYQIVDLGLAFTALRYGVYVGMAALVLIVVQVIFMRKNISWLSVSVSAVLAVVAVGLPMSMMSKAKSVPPIHDISTDLENPPKFQAIAPLRKDASNPVEYAGEETAKQQKQAYPQLTPQAYTQDAQKVFNAARQAMVDFGWELVNADESIGLLEATDTTTWFGFKDDVVVRVQSAGDNSILDVRSKSRVGKSDLGKNAERIEHLIANINKRLSAN